MSKLQDAFRTTRVSIWLIFCALILAATSVYAAGDGRPLAAVDILGSPDAAVNGQFAVGTATPGNKALTVAGVIDFVGAGTVHNYFTQGPGNNMQIRSNVDEYNSVDNASYAQWNMVMGASLDVFSIRRSPASSTYNEDALFWIEGDTGNVGIATVDTGNGASIPFTFEARLHVVTLSGDAIRGVSNATSGSIHGVLGRSDSSEGYGVEGLAIATSGSNYGVLGRSNSSEGSGVAGSVTATSGNAVGVYGISHGPSGRGVYGWAISSSGYNKGVEGMTSSTEGIGVYGHSQTDSGITYGVEGRSLSSTGIGVFGWADADSGYNFGVYGRSDSSTGYDFYAAGTGTDYGPFTGAHEARLSEPFPEEIIAGMIVSGTGEAHIRRTINDDVDISSTLPTVRLANTAEDKAVLGVLVGEVELPEDHWYVSNEGERFVTVNALGEGRVWVTNINGDIEVGDYITTSIIPGYGQTQDDHILRSHTLAKAMETIDWDMVDETVTFNGQEYKVYLLAVVYTSG